MHILEGNTAELTEIKRDRISGARKGRRLEWLAEK